jgi:hypothetical protein
MRNTYACDAFTYAARESSLRKVFPIAPSPPAPEAEQARFPGGRGEKAELIDAANTRAADYGCPRHDSAGPPGQPMGPALAARARSRPPERPGELPLQGACRRWRAPGSSPRAAGRPAAFASRPRGRMEPSMREVIEAVDGRHLPQRLPGCPAAPAREKRTVPAHPSLGRVPSRPMLAVLSGTTVAQMADRTQNHPTTAHRPVAISMIHAHPQSAAR